MSFEEAVRFISEYCGHSAAKINYIEKETNSLTVVGSVLSGDFFELLKDHCFEPVQTVAILIDGKPKTELWIEFIPQIGPT